MALFSKIFHGRFLWVELILWFCLCAIAPLLDFTFDFRLFVHDFNQPDTLVWFVHDFCYTLGMFLFSRAVFIYSNSLLYKCIFQVIMIDWAWELIDLIFFNNALNIKSLLFEGSLLIAATIHAYKTYHK